MRTAKQILADFHTARAAYFKGEVENYARSQAFKEQYLQEALDEVWKSTMFEATSIANKIMGSSIEDRFRNGANSVAKAILECVKERKKT